MFLLYVGVAQLDRAFGYGPKGREFESSNAQYRKVSKNLVFWNFFYLSFGTIYSMIEYMSKRSNFEGLEYGNL